MSSSTSATALSPTPQPVFIDRVVKEVVAPPMYPVGADKIFDKKGLPNLAVLKDHLLREGRLTLDAALSIIRQTTTLFKNEPNMLELKYPITVCGDLHGQFFDLLRLFEVGGDPKDTQYLFLGDYVDRGCFSCEVVIYLYAHKLVYPKTLFMLRGNHECRQLTSFFNFKDECVYKYNMQFYEEVMHSFDQLPLAALINKAFFCVHGGLSPDVSTLEEVKSMDRFQEIPREGPMCDLLWSDPYEEDSQPAMNPDNPDGVHAPAQPKSAENSQWFGYNDTRQCSYVYGIEAVKQFLKDNKLTSVIRAHEAQLDGYKMQMVNKASGIPRVITIFSAPNYCDVYKNKAACLKFDNNVLNIKQFIDSPHPYYLPNFMDVFQWSLPFVAEKVTDMLANVLDYDNENENEDDEDNKKNTVLEKRGGLLKKKVTAVTKLLRMYKILRQEHEAIVQLKQLSPSNKIPIGLLSKGKDGILNELKSFEQVRGADLQNEKRPGAAPATPSSTPAPRTFKQHSITRPASNSIGMGPNSPPPNDMFTPAISVISPTGGATTVSGSAVNSPPPPNRPAPTVTRSPASPKQTTPAPPSQPTSSSPSPQTNKVEVKRATPTSAPTKK